MTLQYPDVVIANDINGGGSTLEKMLLVTESGGDKWVNHSGKSFRWSSPSSAVLHVLLDPHSPPEDQRGWSLPDTPYLPQKASKEPVCPLEAAS